MSLANVRSGIKRNIATATTMDRYTVFDHEHKAPPTWAVIVGWPDTYDPRSTMAGAVDLVIPVRVEIPWQDDESSDAALESAMDAIVAAIELDRTLGGACDDLSCGAFSDIGARTMPDDTVNITFTVPVEVLV